MCQNAAGMCTDLKNNSSKQSHCCKLTVSPFLLISINCNFLIITMRKLWPFSFVTLFISLFITWGMWLLSLSVLYPFCKSSNSIQTMFKLWLFLILFVDLRHWVSWIDVFCVHKKWQLCQEICTYFIYNILNYNFDNCIRQFCRCCSSYSGVSILAMLTDS